MIRFQPLFQSGVGRGDLASPHFHVPPERLGVGSLEGQVAVLAGGLDSGGRPGENSGHGTGAEELAAVGCEVGARPDVPAEVVEGIDLLGRVDYHSQVVALGDLEDLVEWDHVGRAGSVEEDPGGPLGDGALDVGGRRGGLVSGKHDLSAGALQAAVVEGPVPGLDHEFPAESGGVGDAGHQVVLSPGDAGGGGQHRPGGRTRRDQGGLDPEQVGDRPAGRVGEGARPR